METLLKLLPLFFPFLKVFSVFLATVVAVSTTAFNTLDFDLYNPTWFASEPCE